MPAATLDLIGDRVIEANGRYQLDIFLTGNFSASRVRGEIRRAPGGDLLASFRPSTPSYNSETNQTRIRLSLRGIETEKIPIPGPDQFWVYDVLLQQQDSDFTRLLKGRVAVDPGVTNV
jgi:hypothetical protein